MLFAMLMPYAVLRRHRRRRHTLLQLMLLLMSCSLRLTGMLLMMSLPADAAANISIIAQQAQQSIISVAFDFRFAADDLRHAAYRRRFLLPPPPHNRN